MMSKWKEYLIGEIADIVGGSTPSTADPTNFDGDVPWLTPKDLSGLHDRHISRGERNLSEKGLASCSAKLLPLGAVMLSSRAPIGYLAIAKNPIATNQGFRSLILKQGFDSEFIYYSLKANIDELERNASGSTFKELSGSALAHIKIRIPPLPDQRAIAHILGTLDDKIELNRRMNETLEAMARAIFKSWFVDLNPVIDNALRAGNPIPSALAEKAARRREMLCRAKAEGRDSCFPKHIADLFPDRFVDSDLGPIPAGWRVGSVYDEFDITMGQSPPGDTYNKVGEGLPFYQGRADFGFRFPGRRVYCKDPTRYANAGDTLISVRAPVGDINMASENCAIGRGVAAARHKNGSRSYTYQFMRSLEDVFARFEAEGTVFGSIGKKDFHSIRCVRLPYDVVIGFEHLVSPCDNRIEINERESCTLGALRDGLLLRLLSGAFSIKVAEKILRRES